MVSLQSKLELKRKYLSACIVGKLLQEGTLKKVCCGVKSLQVSVSACAQHVVTQCIASVPNY
jgi:hypothetical protein